MALAVALAGWTGLPAPAAANYGALVMNHDTGEELFARNADHRLYPASLTKMMTLYLTFEALEEGRISLDTPVPFSRRAAGQTPAKLHVDTGTHLRVRTLIRAIVTMSGNDCATALAEHLAGSEVEFANRMTAKARQLGMAYTSFKNASGLPNRRQVSTPRDMAKLARALIKDFPQYYHFFSVDDFSFHGRAYDNHNQLLGDYPGVDGLKTGYIRASGYNIVVSAKRHDTRLIAVVFGGQTPSSRDAHVRELLNQGFNQVRRKYAAGTGRPEAAPAAPGLKPAALRETAFAGLSLPPGKPSPAEGGRGTAQGVGSRETASAELAAPPNKPRRGDTAQGIGSREAGDAGGGWAVQIGAFSDERGATQALSSVRQEVAAVPAQAEARVIPVTKDGEQLYRARLTALTQDGAGQLCQRLQAQSFACLPRAPSQ